MIQLKKSIKIILKNQETTTWLTQRHLGKFKILISSIPASKIIHILSNIVIKFQKG